MLNVNNMNQELPITALCVVTDRLKCPMNYTPIFKSYDANTETDLWKDGLFGMGKKINRFISYTKDYPIDETYMVIEDIKLINPGENVIGGFVPLDKCYDTSEKCFQKKVLCIKVSHRFFTSTAVSDIIILVKSKRPPPGYSFIGEINNHIICVKFSLIPKQTSQPPQQQAMHLSQSTQDMIPPSYPHQSIPPRPMSYSQNLNVEDGFIHVRPSPEPPVNSVVGASNDFYNTVQRATNLSQAVYNPLSGVPFEVNPMYDSGKKFKLLDISQLEAKLTRSNNLLMRMNHDFRLERSLV